MGKRPKKYSWGQFDEWKADQEQKEVEKETSRPGTCETCGHGRFSLRIAKPGVMLRKCFNCGDEINPDTGEKANE